MTNSTMRWLVILLSSSALIPSAAIVSAQPTFGVGGGPSLPMGSLSDAVDTGFHAIIVIDVGVRLLPLSLRGDAMFQQLPGGEGGETFRQVAGVFNARLSLVPLPLISFYMIGGLGLYGSSYDPTPAADANGSTVNVGFNGGAGARLNLLVIRPLVEARYHRVLADPARGFVPITIGVQF